MLWLYGAVVLNICFAIFDSFIVGAVANTAFNHIIALGEQAITMESSAWYDKVYAFGEITVTFLDSFIWMLATWDYSFLNEGIGLYFKFALIGGGLLMLLFKVIQAIRGNMTS